MKNFLITIIILLAVLYSLLLILKYSEIKIERIQKLDQDLFENLRKRGFFPNCIPKGMKNIVKVWDIDTNELYVKFEVESNEFYNFDQCKPINKDEIKMPHKKAWIKKVIFPNFVVELNDQIKTNNNLTSYVSYKDYKLAKDKPFYILIDSDKKVGVMFSN